jgi:hypothetical protein
MACRHVATGIACGWRHAAGDGERPDAWCDRCDEQLATAGEWTLEMAHQADMQVICIYCYDLAATRNRDIPKLARGERAVLSGEEHKRLFAHATERLGDAQAESREKWKFDQYARWDFDEGARTLSFSDDNKSTLVADARLVGVMTSQPSRFEWGWALYAENRLLVTGIASLRMFGEVRGLSQVANTGWACKQLDGWQMAALAGYLLGCDGAYRAEFDDKLWFMLLSNWRYARRGRTEPGGFG